MSKKKKMRNMIRPVGNVIKRVQEKKDPNVAPLGSAFTPQGADDIMKAVSNGIRLIMDRFNIRAYAVAMALPIVEWRKDIPLEGGGAKDDFVVTTGRTQAFSGPFQPPPGMDVAVQALFPLLWQGAYGMQVSTKEEAQDTVGGTPVVPSEPLTPAQMTAVESPDQCSDGPGNIIPMAGVPENQPPQETPPA